MFKTATEMNQLAVSRAHAELQNIVARHSATIASAIHDRSDTGNVSLVVQFIVGNNHNKVMHSSVFVKAMTKTASLAVATAICDNLEEYGYTLRWIRTGLLEITW